MEDLRTLNQLQEIDLRYQAIEAELAEIRQQLSDDGDLPKIKSQLQRIENALADQSLKRRTAERKLGQLSETVQDLDRRLYDGSVSNIRELDAMRDQREFSATQLREVEEELLGLMVDSEKFEESRDRHLNAIHRLSRSREETSARLIAKDADLSKALVDLSALRRDCSSGLRPTLLARYEALRKTRGGRALANLEGRICAVCRVELPTGDLAKAKSGHDMVQCNSCRRIIYVG